MLTLSLSSVPSFLQTYSSSRLFQEYAYYTVKNGHRPAAPEGAKLDNFVFEDVGAVSGRANVLRVCEPILTGAGPVNRLGPTCDKRTERPGLRFCHAVGDVPFGAFGIDDENDGDDTPLIRIGWNAVDNAGGLHRGYTVKAFFALNNSLVWDTPFFIDKMHVAWTFSRSSRGDNRRFSVQRNVNYNFAIQAVYGDSNITSLPASCASTMGSGLACAPLHNVPQTCGCPATTVHSCGRPGASHRTWRCEPCPSGTNCSGGTFSGLQTLPGWYVTGNKSNAAADKIPQIYACPAVTSAGNESCRPTNVVGAMSAPLTSKACAPGYTGALCDACQGGFVRDPKHSVCKFCVMPNDTSWVSFFAGVVGIILVAASVLFCVRHFARAPRVERWLLGRIHQMECERGVDGATQWMNQTFAHGVVPGGLAGTTRGETKTDNRVELLRNEMGDAARHDRPFEDREEKGGVREGDDGRGSKAVITPGAKGTGGDLTESDLSAGFHRMGIAHSAKDMKVLWKHIDTNNDGTMSTKEFIDFIHGVRTGSNVSPCRSLAQKLKQWWDSNRSATVRAIILGYFQCLAAIPRLYGASTDTNNDEPMGSESTQPALEAVGLISTSTFSASSSLSSLNRSNANATTAGGGGGEGGVLTLEQIAAFIGDLDITQYRYVPHSFFEYTYVTM